jgi:acyl dehydratase
MAELGPWMITARNREHAEYLIRSRAEQRGVTIDEVDVSGGEGGMWRVSAVVTGSAEAGAAARLGEDTQVIHLDTHRARRTPPIND